MQYAEKLYDGQGENEPAEEDNEEGNEGDIEAEIRKEVEDIRKPNKKALFQSKKVDVQCGMSSISPFSTTQYIDTSIDLF